MRKELAAYRAAHDGVQPGYLAYRARRRVWWRIRRLLGVPSTGSHAWHLLQHRLSRFSSLDVDLQIREWFYRASLPACGEGFCVFPDVVLQYPSNISIGDEVFINRGVTITAPAPVTIGNAVLIGPGVVINSGNHRFGDPDRRIRDQGHDLAGIRIEDDVWLGAGVIVLAGVTIGVGAVVGAGSVVARDIPAGWVATGDVARPTRRRGSAEPELPED